MKDVRIFWSAAALASIFILSSISTGFPVQPKGIVLSKLTMDFGTVVLGSDTVVPEKISNPSQSAITITSASIDGAAFQLGNVTFPLTIAAGQSVSLSITCTPTVVGQISGSLEITTSGSNSYIVVPLSAAAVSNGSLTANPSSINFGAGASGQQITETISNPGGTSVTIYSATTSGSGFVLSAPRLPITLKPNQSTTLTVSIPSSASGNASGAININANIGWQPTGERGQYQASSEKAVKTSLSIPVSGTAASPGRLTAAPSSISFGAVQVGASQTQSATVTNSGSSPVTMTQSSVSGAGFSAAGLPLPITLTPGQSLTFSTVFAPQSAGTAQGTISIASNASNSTVSFQLSGSANAAGQLALSPATLNFGNVSVGKNQSLTATLTASGSSVTLSSASVSNAEFSLAGLQLPVTISPGQSASFTVTFAPQASGTTSASLAFASNGSTPSTVETLTGAGITAPVQHSVALSWSPDSSAVAGYNVYRGTQTGGPYSKINSAPNTATTYGDTSVTAGQTYFYVTTAVNSAGVESPHSNEVQASIPTP